MKTNKVGIAAAFLATCLLTFPGAASAEKGGIGRGGGYTEDGVLYHSHSDRSYSGRDELKGQGTAKGKFKEKGGQKKGNKASQGDYQEDYQAQY